MQIYTVHTKLQSPFLALEKEKMERTTFLREGFCWTAMLFTVLWACWHRMWRHGAMLAAVLLLLNLVVEAMDVVAPTRVLVILGALFVVGFEGNNWRREELEKKKYVLTAVVAAENRDTAIFRYLKNIAEDTPNDNQSTVV